MPRQTTAKVKQLLGVRLAAVGVRLTPPHQQRDQHAGQDPAEQQLVDLARQELGAGVRVTDRRAQRHADQGVPDEADDPADQAAGRHDRALPGGALPGLLRRQRLTLGHRRSRDRLVRRDQGRVARRRGITVARGVRASVQAAGHTDLPRGTGIAGHDKGRRHTWWRRRVPGSAPASVSTIQQASSGTSGSLSASSTVGWSQPASVSAPSRSRTGRRSPVSVICRASGRVSAYQPSFARRARRRGGVPYQLVQTLHREAFRPADLERDGRRRAPGRDRGLVEHLG